MKTITVTRTSKAPRAALFAAATDFANAPSFITAITKMEMLTAPPVGVGTRFRETRTMFGREATEEMTVSGFDPPRSYTLSAESHGARYETVISFRDQPGGGSEIEMRFGAEPLTFIAKLMAFLMAPMMKKMGEMCSKDLEDIAAAAEARSAR